MYALILNGKVIQIEKIPFPVPKFLEWAKCSDEVTCGYRYVNKTFLPPDPDKD